MMTGQPLGYSFEDKVNEGITSHNDIDHGDLMDEDSIHAAGSIFGFLSFCQIALAISCWAITTKGEIDLTTLWGAGASISFIVSMILNVPEVILWPLSFIYNDIIGLIFVIWSHVNTWGAATAFWIGPLFMMIAQFATDPKDLPPSYGVFFIMYLIVGGLVTAV